jgi:hypothetical protein
MVISPERFVNNGDGPCNTSELRKAFWTDVIKSLELSYDLLFQKAHDFNQRAKKFGHNNYIPDLEDRIEQIKMDLSRG